MAGGLWHRLGTGAKGEEDAMKDTLEKSAEAVRRAQALTGSPACFGRCRNGTGGLIPRCDESFKIAKGDDVKTLEEITHQIDGKTVCAFGEASAWPVEAMIDKYREEILSETSEDNDTKSSERVAREKSLATAH